MLNRLIEWWQFYKEYRAMMKASKFFDKNPSVQGRFEELEDWCEELEEKIHKLNKRLNRQARKSGK